MEITKVTNEDAVILAQIVKAMAIARFDNVTAGDMAAVLSGRKWLSELGRQVVALLPKAPSAPAPAGEPGGMKIKAMGPLNNAGSNMKKKNKKK